MNLITDGHLDYWTLQKLLALINATVSEPATNVVSPGVTAAQLEALQAQVTSLKTQITSLANMLVLINGRSLIQNQVTGAMHRMLYLPDAPQDIIIDTNPYDGS